MRWEGRSKYIAKSIDQMGWKQLQATGKSSKGVNVVKGTPECSN
jgi:hypothetical protein